MWLGSAIVLHMVRAWLVLSKGLPLIGEHDDHQNVPPPACQLSPFKGSSRVIGNSKTSFLCVVEASFTTSGLNLDINSTWVQSARDCTRLLAAARQQVKLSSRTLCPILLRQIPQNHHRIDARTPLKPRAHACGFLTLALSRRVQSRRLDGGCSLHTQGTTMTPGAIPGSSSRSARYSLDFLGSVVVARSGRSQRVLTCL